MEIHKWVGGRLDCSSGNITSAGTLGACIYFRAVGGPLLVATYMLAGTLGAIYLSLSAGPS